MNERRYKRMNFSIPVELADKVAALKGRANLSALVADALRSFVDHRTSAELFVIMRAELARLRSAVRSAIAALQKGESE